MAAPRRRETTLDKDMVPASMRRIPLVMMVLLAGCAVVKRYTVRDDYEAEDKHKTKRLLLLVEPLPDGKQKVGEAWARLARRYVNQKRDFIVQADEARATAPTLGELCTGNLEGVLWLKPDVHAKGDGVEASVDGQLLRCRDGQEVWSAWAGGSFKSADSLLVEVSANYGREYGDEVVPYIAPAMNLLRPELDTLPKPEITTEEQDEKIAADE
jgi:probable lipoprotein (TIGR04455 family)